MEGNTCLSHPSGAPGRGGLPRISLPYWVETDHFRLAWSGGFSPGRAPCPSVIRTTSVAGGCEAVPDAIKDWAQWFEEAWTVLVQEMAYPPPSYTDRRLLEVFFCNDTEAWCQLGALTLGLTVTYCSFPEICESGLPETAAYILINPRWHNPATAAHELFHVFQFDYDPTHFWSQHAWWLEATATWMEAQVFPKILTYLEDIRAWLTHPEFSLVNPNPQRAYGSTLFVFHLEESFGRDVVREIWLHPTQGFHTSMEVMDAVLQASYNTTVRDTFLAFVLRNVRLRYTTWDPSATQPPLEVSRFSYQSYPVDGPLPGGIAPEPWGAVYLQFLPAREEAPLSLFFQGEKEVPWVVLVYWKDAQQEDHWGQMALDQGQGCVGFSGFGATVQEVYLIPVVAGQEAASSVAPFTFQATREAACKEDPILGEEFARFQPSGEGPSPSSSSSSHPTCLLAEAFGETPEARYLPALRAFRDQVLALSSWGQGLISLYYQWISPMGVTLLQQFPGLREPVRHLLAWAARGVLHLFPLQHEGALTGASKSCYLDSYVACTGLTREPRDAFPPDPGGGR